MRAGLRSPLGLACSSTLLFLAACTSSNSHAPSAQDAASHLSWHLMAGRIDGSPYVASVTPTHGFAIDCNGQVILAVMTHHKDYARLKQSLVGLVPATIIVDPDFWRGEVFLLDDEPGSSLTIILHFFAPADHAAFIQDFREGGGQSLGLRIFDLQFAAPLDHSAEAWRALQDACGQVTNSTLDCVPRELPSAVTSARSGSHLPP
jgi:hypothetical protein